MNRKLRFAWAALGIIVSGRSLAEFHGTLTVMSNYVYRGYSKSNGKFAFQGNLDYEHDSGFYAGVSVAGVDFGDRGFGNAARVEIAPYLGWTCRISDDWRADGQWLRYWFDGDIAGRRSDYNEFYLLIHYRDLISAHLSFSEDYYNQGRPYGNYEITARYPMTDYAQVSVLAGYSQTHHILDYDYVYWNAGLTFYYKAFALDLRYTDALAAQSYQTAKYGYFDPVLIKPSWLFTLSAGF